MTTFLRIQTIFRKDLRDAIRDARVLIALVLPLGIGVFYNLTLNDVETVQKARVAVFSPDQTVLLQEMATSAGEAVEIEVFEAANRDEVVKEVESEAADLGIVLPPGFDAAVVANQQPDLEVILNSSRTMSGDIVAAQIAPALQTMSGQSPPVLLEVTTALPPDEAETAIDKLGVRRWAILASISIMLSMISILAIPVILTEETEKRTFDALLLISSAREVVAAKALLGLFYISVMIPLLLLLTGFRPEHPLQFASAIALLSGALLGIGLLMAGFFKSANQLNTWSGMLLLPLTAPAFIIGLPAPQALRTAAQLLPTGAGSKLLMNSAASERIFSNGIVSVAVILAWGVAAFSLLLWRLSKREA
jgi:ABC-2 type transport system permease protein